MANPNAVNEQVQGRTVTPVPLRYAWYSVVASLLTMGMKFGAWHMTSSVSILSDALESVVNLVASVMALSSLVIAARPADRDHTYGHGKVEFFSSGLEGVLIIVAAVGIAGASVNRFMHPVELKELGAGLVIALGASVVNFVTARIMLGAARRHESIILEADAKHLLTDVWTSAGLVAGLSLILVAPSWRILDPLIALVMAANIVATGVGLLRRSVRGLMDAALPESEISQVVEAITSVGGKDVIYHGLRTRRSGRMRFIDFHLLLPGETTVKTSHDLCCDMEREIVRRLSHCQVTIHVEPVEDDDSWGEPNLDRLRCSGEGPTD